MEKIKDSEKKRKPINWKEMTELRYLDWSITTPMMLVVLCAALAYNIKKVVHVSVITIIIILNYVMLYLGYRGETGNKMISALFSFLAFFTMYAIIFYHFIRPKYNLPNYILYGLYLVVWSIYGIVYFLEEETKNKFFNILDVISKSLIGLGLWLYYTKIITE
jgi:bacteriorhodopsin